MYMHRGFLKRGWGGGLSPRVNSVGDKIRFMKNSLMKILIKMFEADLLYSSVLEKIYILKSA